MQRSERGAVLIMVGVFSMVMVTMTAFVVDLGNQRQNRVQMTTATDAAALDVGQRWADAELVGTSPPPMSPAPPAGFASLGGDKWDCTVAARAIVRANNGGADPSTVSCIAEKRDHDWGVVTVASGESTPNQFAQGEGNARATTSVKITGAAQGGLRPMAICANIPAVKDFIGGATGNNITFDAVKHLTPECGSASGNWGLLDLDGNGAKSVGGLFAKGYAKSVKKSADPAVCETPATPATPESCFSGSPGAKWNAGPIKSALDYLEGASGCDNGGPEFSVPTYETVLDPNGSNAKFPLTGFLRVQLMCFTVGGSNLNSMTLRLVSWEPDECCSGVSAVNRFLEICDVGTIGGSLGADFESSCGTRSEAPPVPEGCGVDPILPEHQDVPVNSSGLTTGPLQVDVEVNDTAKCGPLRLRAVVQVTERHVEASLPTMLPGAYRFTFPAGTDFGNGGTYLTLVVYEEDYVWDQSATLKTVADSGTPPPPATCNVLTASASPTSVAVSNGSPKTTLQAVKFTLTFAWPSNCGAVAGQLFQTNSSDTIGIGSAEVSETMVFTLPVGTELKQNESWRARFYAGPTLLTLPSTPTITVTN